MHKDELNYRSKDYFYENQGSLESKSRHQAGRMNQRSDYQRNLSQLDHIIAMTYESVENQHHNLQKQYTLKQNSNLFNSALCRNAEIHTNKIQQKPQYVQTVNSSNKHSIEGKKQRQRILGKLTQSEQSLQAKDYVKRSSDSDNNYYNFQIKKSTMNSQYLFRRDGMYDDADEKNSQENQYQRSKQDEEKLWFFQQDNSLHKDLQNFKNPISKRSGFIKQNKLNRRSKGKQDLHNQLRNSQSSFQSSSKKPRHVFERQQFQVHYNNYSDRENPKYEDVDDFKNKKMSSGEFWRKLDEHKSTAQSLKQTFDSEKIHDNNFYTNNTKIKTKSKSKNKKYRSNYSEIDRHARYDDSEQYLEPIINPYLKDYQNDLFDFIKKELINTSIQNKEFLEKHKNISAQHLIQKSKNTNLYHLYKKSKLQNEAMISNHNHQIISMKKHIFLLQEQIVFYKQHSIDIEQSIALKIKKQEDFYFKHKANLQQIVLDNNQKITQLKNLLSRQQSLNATDTQNKNQKGCKEKKTLDSVKRLNQRLREEFKQEQLLYDKALQKLTQNQSKIHQLQIKKAQQIKALVQEFEIAKMQLTYLK